MHLNNCLASLTVFLKIWESEQTKTKSHSRPQRQVCKKTPYLQLLRQTWYTRIHHWAPRPHPVNWVSDAQTVEHYAHRWRKLPICIPATQKLASSKPKARCHVYSFPFDGWTCNDTIPSVIKVSTQASRVLYTRGTPAHTGDDIKGRNRNGGRKRETSIELLGLKRKDIVRNWWIYLIIKKFKNVTLRI